MTNREKLIELLTEKDGKVNAVEIFLLIEKSPFVYPCPLALKCECAKNSCDVCATKWLNEEAKK